MNKIYKSKWGQYFDLSHIVSISQKYRGLYDEESAFHVECILMNDPILLDFYALEKITVDDYYDDLVNAWIKYKNGENEQPK